MAEYARYNVSSTRQWQYFQRVLQVRLRRSQPCTPVLTPSVRATRATTIDTHSSTDKTMGTETEDKISRRGGDDKGGRMSFLPVPLVRTKLIEVKIF